MAIFAGIDWGGHFHQAAVVKEDGSLVATQRFPHDREGMEKLCLFLSDAGQ